MPANRQKVSTPTGASLSRKTVEAAVRLIRKTSPLRPELAMVLGSGFHAVLREAEVLAEISYRRLPGFPAPGVAGHSGKLCLARFGDVPVFLLSGRSHYYEGHDLSAVTCPMRVLHALGVRTVLLTNAAGGIHRQFAVGDFMVLTDHINLMGANPLRGPTFPGCARFVDMTAVYDPALRAGLRAAARGTGAKVRQGVYLAVSGPSYETPAEIRAFARLGADAVGMSTVPEAIVARQCGLRVAGLSCITNLAAGRSQAPLSHTEVLETGERAGQLAAQMLKNFAVNYAKT